MAKFGKQINGICSRALTVVGVGAPGLDYEYDNKGLKFRYARFIDKKTNKDIVVPFLKPLEDAIKQNNGNLAYKISSVKFNEYVKELVAFAKLDEEITLSYTNSFGKKEYEVKMYSKIP